MLAEIWLGKVANLFEEGSSQCFVFIKVSMNITTTCQFYLVKIIF